MLFDRKNTDYFDIAHDKNRTFWSRLGGKPDFVGKAVLDVGSGEGGLCIDMALAGATRVVGLDISSTVIESAKKKLCANYPEIRNVVEFKNIDIKDWQDDECFDYVVAKESFEHIIGLESVFAEMTKRLKPRGKIFVGFGPLYNSASGDHLIFETQIPWAHLIFPEHVRLKLINFNRRRRGQDELAPISDSSWLNKWAFRDYVRMFENSGLAIVFFKVNQSKNIYSRFSNLMKKVPFLEEYFVNQIYCVLEKR